MFTLAFNTTRNVRHARRLLVSDKRAEACGKNRRIYRCGDLNNRDGWNENSMPKDCGCRENNHRIVRAQPSIERESSVLVFQTA